MVVRCNVRIAIRPLRAVGLALACCAVSTPVAASPVADDTASVDFLDLAIEAIEDGDDSEYERLVDLARQGVVWLPSVVLDDLDDRDTDDLNAWAEALDAPDNELYDWAIDAVDYEREQLNAIPLDGDSSTDLTADIEEADSIGTSALELLDRRGVAVPASARLVLSSLGTDAPDDSAYSQAMADLAAMVDSPITTDATAPPPLEPASPVDASVTEQGPVEAPEVADEAGPVDEVADSSQGDLAASPSPSGTSSWLLLTVAGAVALAFVAVGMSMRTARSSQRNDRLADMAFTDALTGLKNRRRMDADIADQAGRDRPTATLMIDVDHFKAFNDTHGHALGDDVLRLVGAALSQHFRATDVPYRYGGEEFCVLLADTNEREALAAGERIRAAVAALELPIDERVTVSVGVSIGPSCELANTLERADGALYAAKETGRNRVSFA